MSLSRVLSGTWYVYPVDRLPDTALLKSPSSNLWIIIPVHVVVISHGDIECIAKHQCSPTGTMVPVRINSSDHSFLTSNFYRCTFEEKRKKEGHTKILFFYRSSIENNDLMQSHFRIKEPKRTLMTEALQAIGTEHSRTPTLWSLVVVTASSVINFKKVRALK